MVEYTDMKGWESSTGGVRTWSQLPRQAQEYVEFIESSIGVKVCVDDHLQSSWYAR